MAAVGAVAVCALVAGAFLLGRGGSEVASSTATPATPESTTTIVPATTTHVPPPTSPPAQTTVLSATTVPAEATPATPAPVATAPIGDVRDVRSGLLCKDLEARGYSYVAAVDYWRLHGQPERMDADRNGIPCETVYPRSDVVAYWPVTTYSESISYGLPSGLLCRDLHERGVGVYDALRYFIWEGFPWRMDADGNGIPCETVYADAATVWLYEF